MAETFLDLIRRLEADPTFGPAMRADQALALVCYDLIQQAQKRPLQWPSHAPLRRHRRHLNAAARIA